MKSETVDYNLENQSGQRRSLRSMGFMWRHLIFGVCGRDAIHRLGSLLNACKQTMLLGPFKSKKLDSLAFASNSHESIDTSLD